MKANYGKRKAKILQQGMVDKNKYAAYKQWLDMGNKPIIKCDCGGEFSFGVNAGEVRICEKKVGDAKAEFFVCPECGKAYIVSVDTEDTLEYKAMYRKELQVTKELEAALQEKLHKAIIVQNLSESEADAMCADLKGAYEKQLKTVDAIKKRLEQMNASLKDKYGASFTG